MGSAVAAEFLDSAGGRIFALLRRPPGHDSRRCVLLVAPFAEEMNKSRRQMTLVAESLLESGMAVLCVDPIGTGDSEGEFSEATWRAWKVNIATALHWAEYVGTPVSAAIGVRLGCALMAEGLRDANLSVHRTVFWQPVASGRQFLTQFLRLRVAATMMGGGSETVEELKRTLASGRSVEVAGYELSPTLWQEIERVELVGALGAHLGEAALIELARADGGDLSVPTRRIVESGRSLGLAIEGVRIVGEPFWASTEIVTNVALVTATVQCLAA